jgi:acyl-CoA thioesterase II
MDARTFLGLTPSHNPFRWTMEVTPGLCVGNGFLFGGSALAAAISAMEITSGRTCVWATAQYLSYAKPGEVLDIDVTIAVHGHQITQARATGHVGNREILTVNAALGRRPFEESGTWDQLPADVPSPDDCPPRELRLISDGSINDRLDMRIAKGRLHAELDGTLSDGTYRMWARIPEISSGFDASSLAVLGDFVPSGIGQALGIMGGGNSLDNTIRIAQLVPTEWVLVDIHIHAVENGFGHGTVKMFAESGTLLAVASQSCIARHWSNPQQEVEQ